MNLNVTLAALVLLAAASPGPLAAQTATAFQTGERVTGSTKQCYYSFVGRRYTRTVQSDQLCPGSIQVPYTAPASVPTQRTAFKTGERVTGSTKQCFYTFAGEEYTRTVRWYRLCPRNIPVRIRAPL